MAAGRPPRHHPGYRLCRMAAARRSSPVQMVDGRLVYLEYEVTQTRPLGPWDSECYMSRDEPLAVVPGNRAAAPHFAKVGRAGPQRHGAIATRILWLLPGGAQRHRFGQAAERRHPQDPHRTGRDPTESQALRADRHPRGKHRYPQLVLTNRMLPSPIGLEWADDSHEQPWPQHRPVLLEAAAGHPVQRLRPDRPRLGRRRCSTERQPVLIDLV